MVVIKALHLMYMRSRITLNIWFHNLTNNWNIWWWEVLFFFIRVVRSFDGWEVPWTGRLVDGLLEAGTFYEWDVLCYGRYVVGLFQPRPAVI
jgi:hypothetical protein